MMLPKLLFTGYVTPTDILYAGKNNYITAIKTFILNYEKKIYASSSIEEALYYGFCSAVEKSFIVNKFIRHNEYIIIYFDYSFAPPRSKFLNLKFQLAEFIPEYSQGWDETDSKKLDWATKMDISLENAKVKTISGKDYLKDKKIILTTKMMSPEEAIESYLAIEAKRLK